MSQGSAVNYYSAELGAEYLAQRKGAASDHVQGLRASLFQDLPAGVVLDFGCGTGGVVSRVPAQRRIGVEIGAEAAALARAAGVEVHTSLAELADKSVDVAISFHAIEHVPDPLSVLRELRRVVRRQVRLVVPSELGTRQTRWTPNRDRHLFTWTALSFGNLADEADFRQIDCRVEPMPTASRLVRALKVLPPAARAAHHALAVRRNGLNVILDAVPGD